MTTATVAGFTKAAVDAAASSAGGVEARMMRALGRSLLAFAAALCLNCAAAATVDVTTCTTPNGVQDNTAGIHTCAAQAGAGGTLVFPNGTYTVEGLQSLHADQTWRCDRYAVLQKPATASTLPILENKANGLRIKGCTLKDTLTNSLSHGILAQGFSIDVDDVKLIDIRGSAIVGSNAMLDVRDTEIINPQYFGIFWSATSTQHGPHIDRVNVYKQSSSNPQSGIAVRAYGENVWHKGTRIADSYVEMGAGQIDSSVGIDVWQGHQPYVHGNETLNGRIAFSFYLCQFGRFTSNFAYAPADYAYEVTAVSYSSVSHNTGLGWGPGLGYFVELSGGSNYNNITDNVPVGFSQNVHGSTLWNTIR